MAVAGRTGSLRLTGLDRAILRLSLTGVSFVPTNCPSVRLFVAFNSDARGGIGGGSDGDDGSFIVDDADLFDAGEKYSDGRTVGETLLLVLVPFMLLRRPTGGLPSFKSNGPDCRRDEDEAMDGGDGLLFTAREEDNQMTSSFLPLPRSQEIGLLACCICLLTSGLSHVNLHSTVN